MPTLLLPWEELENSPTETWTDTGFRATMKLACLWPHRFLIARSILARGGEYYPHRPQTGARAKKVDISPLGAIGKGGDGLLAYPEKMWTKALSDLLSRMASYPRAILTVEYETPELVGTETIEPVVEFRTLDHSKFIWGRVETYTTINGEEATRVVATSDRLAPNEAPGKLELGCDLKVTLNAVRTLPLAMLYLPGHVNHARITFGRTNLVYEAQTLLFHPPTAERRVLPDYSEAWRVSYRFSYRPSGWNRFWRQKTQSWDPILVKRADQSAGESWQEYLNYPVGNFALLFPDAEGNVYDQDLEDLTVEKLTEAEISGQA